MFGLNHPDILHSGVRNFANQVGSRNNDLTGLDQNRARDRQVQFGNARQAQISAPLALADALAKANKRLRRQSKSITIELQDNVIAFVALNPECIGTVVHDLFAVHRSQIHDLALDWRTSGVRAEAVDPNANTMRFAVQHTFVREIDINDPAIDRADNAEWRCRYAAARIAKYEYQDEYQQGRRHGECDIEVTQSQAECHDGNDQEGNALMGNKWIASTFHKRACSKQRAATIPFFVRRVNTFLVLEIR
jgi:hypothetical protein